MNMGLLLTLKQCNFEALVERVRETMSSETPLSISLRRKIKIAPWNLDFPEWINNPEYDIDEHIIHHELSDAIAPCALNNLVADIMRTRMSTSKPMWEFHIITGLSDERTAVVQKLHHTYADGAAGVLLTQAFLDKSTVNKKRRPAHGDPTTMNNNADAPARSAAVLRLTRQLLVTLAVSIALKCHTFYQYYLKRRLRPTDTAAPHTRFNTVISDARSYAVGELPICEIREINKAFSCSRNEVFLATISGALRLYLIENNELPERSLYTGMPLATDAKSKESATLFSFYRSSLATDISDPGERINKIKRRLERSTRRARNNWDRLLVPRLIKAPPRAVLSIVRFYLKLLKADILKPTFNVFSTLMPGPGKSSTITGAVIQDIHPISIPYHGAGLFISGMRYSNKIHFGIIADRKQLPDADHLSELMQQSFSELLTAARKEKL